MSWFVTPPVPAGGGGGGARLVRVFYLLLHGPGRQHADGHVRHPVQLQRPQRTDPRRSCQKRGVGAVNRPPRCQGRWPPTGSGDVQHDRPDRLCHHPADHGALRRGHPPVVHGQHDHGAYAAEYPDRARKGTYSRTGPHARTCASAADGRHGGHHPFCHHRGRNGDSGRELCQLFPVHLFWCAHTCGGRCAIRRLAADQCGSGSSPLRPPRPGTVRGAGVVFFAYIGFDTVSSL